MDIIFHLGKSTRTFESVDALFNNTDRSFRSDLFGSWLATDAKNPKFLLQRVNERLALLDTFKENLEVLKKALREVTANERAEDIVGDVAFMSTDNLKSLLEAINSKLNGN